VVTLEQGVSYVEAFDMLDLFGEDVSEPRLSTEPDLAVDIAFDKRI
jgi:hypothetical protein